MLKELITEHNTFAAGERSMKGLPIALRVSGANPPLCCRTLTLKYDIAKDTEHAEREGSPRTT